MSGAEGRRWRSSVSHRTLDRRGISDRGNGGKLMANGFEKRSPVDCRPSLIRSKIHRKRAQTFSTPPFCTFPRKTCKNVHFREVAGNGVQKVLPLKNVSETLGLLEKNRRNEFADLSLTTWLPRPSRALEQAGGHQSPQAERRAGAPRPCPRSRTDLRFLPAVRVVTPSRLAPRGGVKIGGFEPQDREDRGRADGIRRFRRICAI